MQKIGETCGMQQDAAMNAVNLLIKTEEVQAVDPTTRLTELHWPDVKGGKRAGNTHLRTEGGDV